MQFVSKLINIIRVASGSVKIRIEVSPGIYIYRVSKDSQSPLEVDEEQRINKKIIKFLCGGQILGSVES